ncbi:TPM domain-containing protein [Phenylobacterium sp. J426]|uniref:TPM domain-containing protein n=1 Tax=Phenylobacterium sp. J426 TaxID=2898439 RepID=UPI002150ED22|nr:TPM domain-containing protein [Phenylobacterium sp. J426]MCR5874480.1 TPM domain-containing protein [Phenylobacterium sp. J426]
MEKVLLSPSDRAAIEAAVREAETRTTGEIYCVFAEESSDYRETPLAWAAGVALLGPAILLLAGVHVEAPDLLGGWTAAQVSSVAEAAARRALIGAVLLQGALFVLALAVVSVPALRRALTPRGLKRDRVRRRAQEQFVAKNLHATRERTGVLIYVSFAEHMAELIADEGIAGGGGATGVGPGYGRLDGGIEARRTRGGLRLGHRPLRRRAGGTLSSACRRQP